MDDGYPPWRGPDARAPLVAGIAGTPAARERGSSLGAQRLAERGISKGKRTHAPGRLRSCPLNWGHAPGTRSEGTSEHTPRRGNATRLGTRRADGGSVAAVVVGPPVVATAIELAAQPAADHGARHAAEDRVAGLLAAAADLVADRRAGETASGGAEPLVLGHDRPPVRIGRAPQRRTGSEQADREQSCCRTLRPHVPSPPTGRQPNRCQRIDASESMPA